MTSKPVEGFALIFALGQISGAERVRNQNLTLDNNLSLNPNRCHHPLTTQLSLFVCFYRPTQRSSNDMTKYFTPSSGMEAALVSF